MGIENAGFKRSGPRDPVIGKQGDQANLKALHKPKNTYSGLIRKDITQIGRAHV